MVSHREVFVVGLTNLPTSHHHTRGGGAVVSIGGDTLPDRVRDKGEYDWCRHACLLERAGDRRGEPDNNVRLLGGELVGKDAQLAAVALPTGMRQRCSPLFMSTATGLPKGGLSSGSPRGPGR